MRLEAEHLPVDRNAPRPLQDDDEDVALVVHVFGRATSGRPREQRRVEILRRMPQSGPEPTGAARSTGPVIGMGRTR